jgi:hypothetical protein
MPSPWPRQKPHFSNSLIQPETLRVSSLLLKHLIKCAHSRAKGIGLVVALTRSSMRVFSVGVHSGARVNCFRVLATQPGMIKIEQGSEQC